MFCIDIDSKIISELKLHKSDESIYMTFHINEYEKEQQKKIIEEISKHSYQKFEAFKKLFPCTGLLVVEITYHLDPKYGHQDMFSYYYYYDGAQKFWKNWHKFKNLKAFL